MSDKKRYFYVVFVAGIKSNPSSRATGSAACNTDNGKLFSKKQFIRNTESINNELVDIVITDWIEFDNKEDYEAFYE